MVEEKTTKVEKEIKEEVVETEKVDKTTEKKVEFKAKKKTEKRIHDKAIANGFGLKISPKQCKYVCRIIRGKNPDAAIKRLQDVIDEKRPVPMAGLEVGHKRGRGLSGGKFPKNACKNIMEIIKQAAANAIINEIENPVIVIAKSNAASAPYRKAGRKAKRTHIYIEIKDKIKMMEGKK